MLELSLRTVFSQDFPSLPISTVHGVFLRHFGDLARQTTVPV